MKGYIVVVLASLLALSARAQCPDGPPYSPVSLQSYYRSTEGISGIDLQDALNQIIRGHTRYPFTPCIWQILAEADEAPSDPTSVVAFYTGRLIAKTNRDSGQNDPNSWNREQIWAMSHGFPNQSQHAFSDLHHIRAAVRSVNSDRSDHDFDTGGTPDDECTACREGEGTWEPPDNVKGDVARMMFYMDVRYDGNDGSGTPDLRLVDRANTERSETIGEFGKLCTLYAWHAEDPVSAAERQRNDVIQSWQGNRNPFIDHPEFVAEIWGPRCITTPPGEEVPEPGELLERLDTLAAEIAALREIIEEMTDPE